MAYVVSTLDIEQWFPESLRSDTTDRRSKKIVHSLSGGDT